MVVILALLASTAAVALSARRLSRLKARVPEPEAKWVASLGPAPAPEAVERALAGLSPEHPVRGLIEAALTARSKARAITDINERISDIEGELEEGKAVPSAAARIAGFTAVLLAVVELARTVPRGVDIANVFSTIAVGATGAVGCALLGRRADKVAQERRSAYDALSRTLERWVTSRFGAG